MKAFSRTMNFFFFILAKFGIDKAIFYSIGLRAWQLFTGPLTLFFIAKYFTPAQQGFYYTFGSILTMQMFFEMGLSFVIIQFTSHEFAGLRWKKMGAVSGQNITRFKALLAKSFFWYAVISILFFLIIAPWGNYFFGLKAHDLSFEWRTPWNLLVLLTTLNLLLTPLLAIIEGSGRVQEIYRLRFTQNIFGTALAWLIIVSGGGLYNALAVAFTNAAISFFWLYTRNKALLRIASSWRTFKKLKTSTSFSWSTEVWPMQWRIAISWVASYFIYQISVPIIFYYHGSTMAGQLGMTLTITSMITVMGQAWLNAKTPIFGRLVATQNWPELDQLFYKIVFQSTAFILLTCLGLIAFTFVFRNFIIVHRLLSLSQITLLAASAIFNHLINCFGQYLRSHKREPFMVPAIISAFLFGSTGWYFGKQYSINGLIITFLLLNILWGFPAAIFLWLKAKKDWHIT